MKASFIFLILFSFVFSWANDLQDQPVPGQRASGTLGNNLKWNLYFNFPRCDHDGQKKGAWCLHEDYGASIKSNGVDEHLKSWIQNPATKSIYMSYFSFSNNSIAKALCAETAKRQLNVKVYLDAGPGQTSGFLSNIERADQKLQDQDPSYQGGCKERIYDKMEKRGSGGCCSNGYFLQHAKIFLALQTEKLFDESWQLMDWASNAGRIKFTSSSANMSSKGTAMHFENWLFFDARAYDNLALQNVCALWAFGKAKFYDNPEQDIAEQRKGFKAAYSDCKSNINTSVAPRRRDISFYMVPSHSNNQGFGPSRALNNMLRYNAGAGDKVRVAIHRLTTSAVRNPLIRSKNRGAQVTVLMDDDSLRSSLDGAGLGLDVNFLDANSYRKLDRAGLTVRFVETNGDSYHHLFHNKFIIAGEKRVFQGAGNFTSTALNAWNTDGSYEQFYILKDRNMVKAYIDGWEYLKGISSSREEHPQGHLPNNCKVNNPGGGLPQLVSCDAEGAQHY